MLARALEQQPLVQQRDPLLLTPQLSLLLFARLLHDEELRQQLDLGLCCPLLKVTLSVSKRLQRWRWVTFS